MVAYSVWLLMMLEFLSSSVKVESSYVNVISETIAKPFRCMVNFVPTSHLKTISYFIVQVNQTMGLYLSSFLLFGKILNFKFSLFTLLNYVQVYISTDIATCARTHIPHTHTYTLTLAI